MSGVTNAGSIRELITGPSVARTLALALVGRLTYGLLPLCFLFTVRDSSGSFAVAAAASAALGLATLAMPLQARLLDRHGQRRALPCYALAFSTLLCTAGLLAGGSWPAGAWVGASVLLGLTAPALGPSMRAQWREITAEGPARRVAYSLDSIAEESLYLLGPLAASAVLATGQPRLGLLVAAGLVVVGAAGLATSAYVPAAASARPGSDVDGLQAQPVRTSSTGSGALRHRGLGALLVVMALAGAAGAACFVGVAGIADGAGVPSAVGLVEAGMALGAIAAGLAWARVRREVPWPAALALLLTSAACQSGAAVAAPGLLVVGLILVVVGAVAAPVFVVAFTGADELVPPDQRTEASTWVSTAFNGGNAIGTASAGLVLRPRMR